jgi:putative tricarboxylic transport membrane protein
MSDKAQGGGTAGPSQRGAEVGVAIAMAVFALIVIAGSIQAGMDWGPDGPRAGFFPFYVGVAILIASAVNLIQALAQPAGELFAEWGQLRQVLAVVVPAAIYVAVIPLIGIYVSSFLLIAFFMRRLGNYGWLLIASVSLFVPILTFVVFEQWFLVPLPKGPVEAWLGF